MKDAEAMAKQVLADDAARRKTQAATLSGSGESKLVFCDARWREAPYLSFKAAVNYPRRSSR